MTQTTSLPGHLITIRLYNQPLAQALLDAGIAVEPDTSGIRFACRADPREPLRHGTAGRKRKN